MSIRVITSTNIDDRHSNVSYVPEGQWTVHTNVQSIFHLYENSDTFHDRQGATATVRFYGNAIEYWGNQGPYHGPCAVSIDGVEKATVNSHADADGYPILLYSTDDLELGDHTLEVKILGSSYPNVCEIDRFVANVTTTQGTVSGNGNDGNGYGDGEGGGGGESGPPIAAIAGGVGGGVGLCLILLGFWWYRRSKNSKAKQAGGIIGASGAGKAAKHGRLSKNGGIEPLLSDGLASPSPHVEKQGFNIPHSNQPTSYVSSSPPASSYNPPSTYAPGSPPPGAGAPVAGFNPYAASYTTNSTTVPSSVVGTIPLPNSPQPTNRPMSTISSTSGAPTTAYYGHGPEGAAGFAAYQQQQQQQQQQQPHNAPVSAVWAIPEQPSSPGPVHVHQPSAPSPSTTPAPVASHPSASPSPAPTSYPPEKAQYRSEKAGYSGSNAATSTAGASGSGSSAAPVAGGSGQHDIMSPAVPELPPPAYQM